MVQLEGSTQTALQKAMQANNERMAVQAALDKALNDFSLATRKVTETDKAQAATQSRLKAMESSLAEALAERTRLSAALDEANHKHLEEASQQSARFEALQARAGLTENLLEEARQTLMARADEIRTLERRVVESTDAHGTAGEKLSLTASALAELELRIKDHEQSHTALNEQNQALLHAVSTRETAHSRSQQKIKEQEELVALLEGQLKNAREEAATQIEQLSSQIQRERIERAMAEGALESGRKDIARLMRELSALQHRPGAATAPLAAPAAETPGEPGRMKSAA
jgi:chromosome segregation ATPase